ncbi:sensor histidine kinase [Microbacterium sp. G2-8]|uniref:sensor histidine kinase n=1 Tax=Microbacterium sp. G2-8 TaxID=2842454 RepID=UPI001C8A7F29|nr:hypothetical protein [Microbacterium sp. G2-8]
MTDPAAAPPASPSTARTAHSAWHWPRARIAALVATVNVVAFAVLVAEQATEWSTSWDPHALIWWVGGVTLVIGIVLVGITMLACAALPAWWMRIAVAVVLSAVQATVRTALLLPATTAEHATPGAVAVWATGFIGHVVALGTGFLVAALIEREDRERTRRRLEEQRSREAIDELEHEELRVRRMVADRLHGTVQHRLVVIASGLDQMADQLERSAEEGRVHTLRDWAAELDELREEHVRSLSHSLFPSGADLGAYEAIRALLDRLPTTVATSVELGPTMRDLVHSHGAVLPLLDRLVVVYTVEEAVTNALKHGGATAVTVRIEAEKTTAGRWLLDVVIDDDGTGPTSDAPVLSGLARHRSRAEARGGSLSLGRSEDGGGRLHLVLPFEEPAAGRAERASADRRP